MSGCSIYLGYQRRLYIRQHERERDIYIYIYIYREREREREIERDGNTLSPIRLSQIKNNVYPNIILVILSIDIMTLTLNIPNISPSELGPKPDFFLNFKACSHSHWALMSS